MDFTPEDLGQVIRDRRQRRSPALRQRALGELAGYGPGKSAAVSMSRVENGHVSPSVERLAGIAAALGTTPAELEAEARERAARRTGDDAGQLSVRKRVQRLETDIAARTGRVVELGERFNAANSLATTQFLDPFLEVAGQIEGAAPAAYPESLSKEQASDPALVAEYRLRHSKSAVMSGGSAESSAYGAAISGLSGASASNATFAALGGGLLSAGGAGMARGLAVLTGIVGSPALILGGLGVAWMVRRQRRKEREQHEILDRAEAELRDTGPNYAGLVAAMERAAVVLEHIGVHGARARELWAKRLPPDRPLAWDALTDQQRAAFDDLLAVAAGQIAVADMNFEAFMKFGGADLDQLVAVTNELLTQSWRMVESRV